MVMSNPAAQKSVLLSLHPFIFEWSVKWNIWGVCLEGDVNLCVPVYLNTPWTDLLFCYHLTVADHVYVYIYIYGIYIYAHTYTYININIYK